MLSEGLHRIATRYLIALCLVPWTMADPPAGHYDSVDFTDPTTFRQTLHGVIDDHTRFPYTNGSTDTWDILEQADEDPGNPSNILDVYRNASYPKAGGDNANYNREHTWPSSYGFTDDGAGNYPFTDCHHLFLVDSNYNSSRSNRPYSNCDPSCDERPTVANNGQGGGSGVYPGNSNWVEGFIATEGTWETWIGRRGDVARALFYLDVRYEGGTHGVTDDPEPDLILTDDTSLIVSSTSNQSVAHMGILSVLVQWHSQDPVSDMERDRNDVVFGFQGNRNPFIDHPEWVGILFESNTGRDVWINEIHYDNTGGDVGEFVEVAGRAGTDLSSWRVVGYNGDGGGTYDTLHLSGVIPLQQECHGTLSFPFSGMQNGPDGLALVDPVGQVIELLSYEGTFTATAGPATGMNSVDIGVSESSITPVGHSLQLTGSASSSEGFTWAEPMADTPGLPNTGQTMVCVQDETPPVAPTGLIATGGEGEVDLDWDDNTESDLAGYNVLRSETSGGPHTQVNGPPVLLSEYTDTGVTNGVEYHYVVTALDTADNESAISNEDSATPESGPAPPGLWINEIHYDNDGGDTGEIVEIAGPAGVDLTDWTLVGYNGSGGGVYTALALSGVLPNQQDCIGTLSFDFTGMQNGAPDGLALVDPEGEVVQFLSYEGTFMATDGPASGMTSIDIGVSETGVTPVGHSLQLGGTGSVYSDFVWQSALPNTAGQPNTGQTFLGGCVDETPTGTLLR
jgi:endonuclease I